MIFTFLTVVAAAVLGGAIAADLKAIVVIAGVALALIGIVNGMRAFTRLCDLRRD